MYAAILAIFFLFLQSDNYFNSVLWPQPKSERWEARTWLCHSIESAEAVKTLLKGFSLQQNTDKWISFLGKPLVFATFNKKNTKLFIKKKNLRDFSG